MKRRFHLRQTRLDLGCFVLCQFTHFRVIQHRFGRFKIVQRLRVGANFFNHWPKLCILTTKLGYIATALSHLRFDEFEPARNLV